MRRLSRCLASGGEAGFTLIELLVAASMGIVLLGVAGSLLLAPLRQQPKLEQKAADVQTARWVLERLTRELREGKSVEKATPSSVSFLTFVRHQTCGGTAVLPSGSPSTECEVTYTCASSSCTRIEAEPGVYTGTATTIFNGLGNSESVFSYSPNTSEPTYVQVTLEFPNPSGSGALTASDGASLRNATLEK